MTTQVDYALLKDKLVAIKDSLKWNNTMK
jgi:hypothetical protein